MHNDFTKQVLLSRCYSFVIYFRLDTVEKHGIINLRKFRKNRDNMKRVSLLNKGNPIPANTQKHKKEQRELIQLKEQLEYIQGFKKKKIRNSVKDRQS